MSYLLFFLFLCSVDAEQKPEYPIAIHIGHTVYPAVLSPDRSSVERRWYPSITPLGVVKGVGIVLGSIELFLLWNICKEILAHPLIKKVLSLPDRYKRGVIAEGDHQLFLSFFIEKESELISLWQEIGTVKQYIRSLIFPRLFSLVFRCIPLIGIPLYEFFSQMQEIVTVLLQLERVIERKLSLVSPL